MRYLKNTLLTVGVLAILVVPAYAQADVGAQIESFFADVETIMMAVATSAAVIGFIGLAIVRREAA